MYKIKIPIAERKREKCLLLFLEFLGNRPAVPVGAAGEKFFENSLFLEIFKVLPLFENSVPNFDEP